VSRSKRLVCVARPALFSYSSECLASALTQVVESHLLPVLPHLLRCFVTHVPLDCIAVWSASLCLAAHGAESRRWTEGVTPGYVKLLLPPRQSRGNSHWGLAVISSAPVAVGTRVSPRAPRSRVESRRGPGFE
jgi:hypothetical protein